MKTGKTLEKNYKALRKLRSHCEKAKKVLSSLAETVIDIPCLAGDADFSLKITRDKFEEVNKSIFDKCRDTLTRLIDKSNLSKEDIQEIVLLGGSSRVPKVKQVIKAFFGKDPLCNINADEAVANGAAIHAAMLSNELYSHGVLLSGKILMNDVLTSTFGIRTSMSGDFIPVLAQNTPIPAKSTSKFKEEITKIETVDFVEKSADGSKNLILDSISVPECRNLELTMEIDSLNMITVVLSFSDLTGKTVSGGCVVNCREKLSMGEMEAIAKSEEEFRREDEAFIRAKESKNELEKFVTTIKANRKVFPEKAKVLFDHFIDSSLNWIENNQKLSEKEYNKKRLQFKDVLNALEKGEYVKLANIEGLPDELKKMALLIDK